MIADIFLFINTTGFLCRMLQHYYLFMSNYVTSAKTRKRNSSR